VARVRTCVCVREMNDPNKNARLRVFQAAVAAAHGAQVAASAYVVSRDPGYAALRVGADCYAYAFAWLLPAFAACSCVAHAAIAVRGPPHSRVNAVRWIEYAISSSLCNWVVATLVGIEYLWALAPLTAANAAMMVTGWAAEYRIAHDANPLRALVAGWALFAGVWGVIIGMFVRAVTVRPGDDPSPPNSVLYGVPIGLVFLNATFGVLMVWYAWPYMRGYKPLPGDAPWRRFVRAEYGYSVLSLTAKSFLMWMVLGGAQRPREATCT